MKKKLIIRIAVLAVGLGAAAALGLTVLGDSDSGPPLMMTTTLLPGDLVRTVSVTGTVESEESEKIYTTLNYPVKEVLVEVGDTVAAGDVLCELDTSDLVSDIAQQRSTINAQRQSTDQSVYQAQRDLEFAKRALEEDYNQQVQNAEQAVELAEANLEKAGIALREARQDLRVYMDRDDRPDERDGDEWNRSHDSELLSLRTARDTAYITYETAQKELEFAKTALDSIRRQSADEIVTYEDAITSAQVGGAGVETQVLILQKMEQDLADAVIVSPVSGTVTAVYAEEGMSPNGILFVIENTGRLRVDTAIKEYDIASIALGNRVEIRTDATGDEVFEGSISKIAPTSNKNSSGESADTTEAEFATQVRVNTGVSSLRIGLKARLEIVVEEKNGIFAVPYEAVVFNEEGEEIVYRVDRNEEGGAIAVPVVVATGMENDFNLEISAPELSEGDELILDAAMVTEPGMVIQLESDLLDEMGEGE